MLYIMLLVNLEVPVSILYLKSPGLPEPDKGIVVARLSAKQQNTSRIRSRVGTKKPNTKKPTQKKQKSKHEKTHLKWVFFAIFHCKSPY